MRGWTWLASMSSHGDNSSAIIFTNRQMVMARAGLRVIDTSFRTSQGRMGQSPWGSPMAAQQPFEGMPLGFSLAYHG